MNEYPFELENYDPEVDKITSEVIEHDLVTTDRSIARRASLQILYELDTTKHSIGEVLDTHLQERPDSTDVRRIIIALVRGVAEHREWLDEFIQRYAPDWPIEQVAVVDRNILRIAVYEYAIQKRAPIPVIINEAVHLAQVFGAENSHGFVHGVLGSIIDDDETPDKTVDLDDDKAEMS
jgi:transcription antitermination protein NusB